MIESRLQETKVDGDAYVLGGTEPRFRTAVARGRPRSPSRLRMLMIVLDATLGNVALSSIQDDLGFCTSSLTDTAHAIPGKHK